MAFLFARNRPRSSLELCNSTKDLLRKIEGSRDEKLIPRIEAEIARNLSQMRATLQGTTEPLPPSVVVFQLVHALLESNMLCPLAKNIHKIPFEARKDTQVIFSSLLRYRLANAQPDDDPPFLSYIINKCPEIIPTLCNGYDHREGAMFCGAVLREALKHDSVCALVLYDEPTQDGSSRGLNGIDPNIPASGKGVFWKFFNWIDKCEFATGANAFNTFQEALIKHKKLTSHYILVNIDRFMDSYNRMLLLSQSYVTQRQSIKLLAGLLLDRANYAFMTRYVEFEANLKLVMTLLRDDRRMVSYEVFHIFKVFVANPHKSVPVQRILINNKDRLLRFLPNFHADLRDDPQFEDEKAYLIRMIENLPEAPVPHQQPSTTVGVGGGSGGANGHGALMA